MCPLSSVFFHPVFVHFPIAFYFLELILLILWKIKADEGYNRFARLSFKLGYLSMVLAVATGFLKVGGLKGITGLVTWHFYSAMAVLIFFPRASFF